MTRANREPRRGTGIDWPLVAFVLALCALAFAYGVAAMRFKIFPYTVITKAEAAAVALTSLGADDLMAGALELDPKAPAAPTVKTLAAGAGTERLLVAGGPYQMMSRCPTHGCWAWVIDRQGNILHSWEVDLDKLLAGMPKPAGRTKTSNFYPQGMALQPDGSLVFTIIGFNTYPYQIGLAKVSKSGEVLWTRWTNNHHWIVTDAAGTIYAPGMTFKKDMTYFGESFVDTRCNGQVMAESIDIFAPDGTLQRRYDLIDTIERSDRPGLLYGLRDGCDPIHLNSIDLATPAAAVRLPGVEAGDMLVSLRESDTIAVVGRRDGLIKYAVTGRTAAQHSPKFLPDGTVLVFDNLGGRRKTGGSRIVRVDLATGETSTVFPREGNTAELPFVSDDGGHLEISPDGKRAMVITKEPGRAIEIDIATGQPLWSLRSGMDIGPYLKANGIDAPTTRAWFKNWGVYYITDTLFETAGLGGQS